MNFITVKQLLEYNNAHNNVFGIILETNNGNLESHITKIDINRPGLTLSGFFDKFSYDRVQIFGRGESAFLNSLSEKKIEDMLKQFFKYRVNLCIFTHGISPPEIFFKFAKQNHVPILISNLSTASCIASLTQFLDFQLAPSINIHGVLNEVFGVGVLLIGKSGVGKSEAALELIKRGHRFIADDFVLIKRISHSHLFGSADSVISHKMEVRGLGIIDVKRIFGIGSVLDTKKIDLVIQLDEWNPKHNYDRLGTGNLTYEILNVPVPMIKLPIKAGRNLAVIIETSVMNKRLQDSGFNSLDEIADDMTKKMKDGDL